MVTIPLEPGFNAIANPLHRGGNTLNEVLPVVPDGTEFHKWIPVLHGYRVSTYHQAAAQWMPVDTLEPGEGGFLRVTSAFSLVLTGEIRPAMSRTELGPGHHLVSCQRPTACGFEQALGFLPRPGDTVFKLPNVLPEAPTNIPAAAIQTHTFSAGGWDTVPRFAGTRPSFILLSDQPRVAIQPPQLLAIAGADAMFQAVAQGTPPFQFQWFLDGQPLADETNATLFLPGVQAENTGAYTVEASNSLGVAVSLPATLGLLVPPGITRDPSNQTVALGKTAQFSVEAAGTPPLYFGWLKDNAPFVPLGAGGPVLTLSNATPADMGRYRAVVSNAAAVVLSAEAMLAVIEPPVVLMPPVTVVANVGQLAEFHVVAQGTPPLTYQWRRNGNVIPGENGPQLIIPSVEAANGGVYQVVVANAAGAVITAPVELQLNLPAIQLGDDFAAGDVVSDPIGLYLGQNFGATRQPGEPRHAGKTGGRSVWLTYFATINGQLTVSTRGSTLDTLLAAYTGNSVSNLVELASNDDTAGGFLASKIVFNVQQGGIYRIAVDGFAGGEGRIVLEWELEPVELALDRLPVIITHPQSRTVSPGTLVSLFVNVAGGMPGMPLSYQWFFLGQPIGGNQPFITLPAVGPANVGPYFVRVFSGDRFVDSRIADVEISAVDPGGQAQNVRSVDKLEDITTIAGRPPGAAGFAPAAPVTVLGYTGSHVGNTSGSGGQTPEPVHCGVLGGATRWFAYLPPTNGLLHLDTFGSSFDTVLAVYTGSGTFANLVPVPNGCNNNTSTSLTSSVEFPATNGIIYWIAVDGVNAATGVARLNYRLFVPMMLTNAARTNLSLSFGLTATPYWPFTVQRSIDGVIWNSFFTNTTSNGVYFFTDTNALSPHRFYRTLQTP
jgi:hypothetical protein